MESPASVAFGQLLKRLRDGKRQIVFARDLNISRQQYSMIKSGRRRPDDQLRETLIGLFPEHQSEINATYSRVEEERETTRALRAAIRSPVDPGLRRILIGLIEVGRFREAKRSINRALATDPEPAARVWFLERLAEVESRDDDPGKSVAALEVAIEVAHKANLHDEETRLRIAVARRLALRAEYEAALLVLDEGLKYHPTVGSLWRRKGIVHWYEHEYGEAYACLEAARLNGIPLSRIIHSRGQILAEWGNYAAAVEDLTQAIEEATTPANEAYARSTRAYALANLGDVDRAMAEFDLAETTTPDNAWLHYFRALYHGKIGNVERLIEGLTRALDCETPRLNPAKRAHAIAILREHDIDINYE